MKNIFDILPKSWREKLHEATTSKERSQIAERKNDVAGLLMRQYAAAETGRTMSDWMTVSGNPTADIRNGYRMVLKRARDLYQNDPTGRHIPTTFVNNICGPFGFSFQSKVVSDIPDAAGNFGDDSSLNAVIETGFWDWGTPLHCTIGGRLSWRAVQELLVKHWIRDGEALCEHRLNESKYGYQLKPLQPELIDIDKNEELRGGNIVVQGVELDADERVVAYWLRTPRTTDRIHGWYDTGARSERVPADRLYHIFDQQHACQVRGMSFMDAIMTRMKLMSDWERFQWIAAKVNSALAIAVKNQPSTTSSPLTSTIAKQNTDTKQFEMDFSELMMWDLGNKDMIVDRAKFPNEMYADVQTAILARLGSGVEFDLPLISNDPSNANFSSARFGAANTQENFKRLQESFKDQFHYWVYRDWLKAALLKGALTFPSGKSLPFYKYERIAAAGQFTGRRWDFIQPLQDIMAKAVAAKMRWMSDQQYFAEKGLDMDETYTDIKAAADKRKAMGIPSELDAEIFGALDAVLKLDEAQNAGDEKKADEAANQFVREVTKILFNKRNGNGKVHV